MKFFRRLWPYMLLAVLVAINVTIWSQRQQIADWWKLHDYQASSDVASLATDTAMTDYARRLFYVNHPSLEEKDAFNMHCADKSEQTAVLGCYHGNRQGIYLYAVTDKRLHGVRQVTAAHEMLHQAYDRLSEKEKTRIKGLLEAFYANNLNEATIKAKLDGYKKQTDVDLVNEMHSIFGSEVQNLPPELETYYQKYFSDRSKVLGFSQAYQGEFTRRQDLVRQYDDQLTGLKQKINDNKSILETKMALLKTKEAAINQDVNSHNQSAYEADIREYNATVTAYNTLLTATRALIDEHNDIVGKRNDITVQEQQLQQALDSRLDTPSVKQ